MARRFLSCAAGLLCCVPLMLASDIQTKGSAARLSAAEIVEKNVAARGGLSAWRAVKTLELKGKLDAGGNNRPTIPVPGVKRGSQLGTPRPTEQVKLPFLMDLERGRKMRLEIEFNGQTAIQVYNGTQGWKLRPFLNRHQVENFTPEELQSQASQSDLDGYLIDYAAKGEKVELEGVEQVEGHDAYNLKVTDSAGHSRHVWIDAANFLEVKVEGVPRRLDGKYHPVATYLRDYRNVGGLVMPYLMETAVDGVKDKEKIEIETIVSNPKLDDSRFVMPR
jgi:outer membrane lipoprotein-sorting protein